MQIYSPTLTQKLDHIPCFGLCVCVRMLLCVSKRQTERKTGFFTAAVVLDFNILQLTSYKDSALFSQTKKKHLKEST